MRVAALALWIALAGLAVACGDSDKQSSGETSDKAAAGPDRPKKTIYEALPELCEAVDLRDPRDTDRSLKAQGFDVRWTLVNFIEGGDTRTRRLQSVPATGVIISVLDRKGRYANIAPGTKRLDLEVTQDESRHPVAEDAACS